MADVMEAPSTAQDGGSGQKLDDPGMIKEANRFALKLVQDKDLILGWFDRLAKALKEKTYEVQIMDNFIAEKSVNGVDDFQTTYAYVIQAQQKLPAYKIFYWSGLYKTTRKAKGGDSEEGSVVSVVGSGSTKTATYVSLAKAELIGYDFKQLVLSWDGQQGFNASSGKLIFGVRNISGKATRRCAGTITEGGTDDTYAGVVVDPNSPGGKTAGGKAPPQTHQDLQKLQYANQIINMVSQALFMAVNIGMLYKTGKEIQELRAKIKKGEGSEQDKADLEKLEGEQEVSERAADQAVENADDVRQPVEEMSDEDFAEGSEDASPASESDELPDLEPPSDMEDLALSEEEADTAQEAIENEIEEAGEEVNDYDDSGSEAEDGEEGGVMEDGENVLENVAEDFV